LAVLLGGCCRTGCSQSCIIGVNRAIGDVCVPAVTVGQKSERAKSERAKSKRLQHPSGFDLEAQARPPFPALWQRSGTHVEDVWPSWPTLPALRRSGAAACAPRPSRRGTPPRVPLTHRWRAEARAVSEGCYTAARARVQAGGWADSDASLTLSWAAAPRPESEGCYTGASAPRVPLTHRWRAGARAVSEGCYTGRPACAFSSARPP
jgi:hypothetical protein